MKFPARNLRFARRLTKLLCCGLLALAFEGSAFGQEPLDATAQERENARKLVEILEASKQRLIKYFEPGKYVVPVAVPSQISRDFARMPRVSHKEIDLAMDQFATDGRSYAEYQANRYLVIVFVAYLLPDDPKVLRPESRQQMIDLARGSTSDNETGWPWKLENGRKALYLTKISTGEGGSDDLTPKSVWQMLKAEVGYYINYQAP